MLSSISGVDEGPMQAFHSRATANIYHSHHHPGNRTGLSPDNSRHADGWPVHRVAAMALDTTFIIANGMLVLAAALLSLV